MQITLFQLTVDIESVDQSCNSVDRFQPELPQGAGLVLPHHFLQLVLIRPLTGADVAAIAARSAPTHPVCLQKDNAIAEVSQMYGAGQSGIAATNNANIGLVLARQCRELRSIIR